MSSERPWWDESEVHMIQSNPPEVDATRRLVLYTPQGVPLYRPVGFRGRQQES